MSDVGVSFFLVKEFVGYIPTGTTGCHLKVSRITASMYGKDALSLGSGSLPDPMTRSSSAWALACASG